MSTAPQSRQAQEAAIPGTVFDDASAAGARSYAEALLNVAAQGGQIEAVVGELEDIVADVLAANPQFAAILTSPALNPEQKDRVLVELFEGRALPAVVNFLRVLNRHGRLPLLPLVAREARAIWDRRQNRRQVAVRSAVPLDDAQLARLREKVAQMAGGEPVLKVQVDPSMLGGLVIQIGDEVFDTSVRTQLERMRRQIVEGKLHEVRGRLAESLTA
jgi:F-type H+-transporting ATPase subunit delta